MKKSIKEMSYDELLTEREQIKKRYQESVSHYTRRDLSKYLKKLDQEIGERRKKL